MKTNIIEDKTYKFAILIVNLCKQLIYKHHNYVISKQLLKSGTSVGANVAEANAAISKKEFVQKLQYSYKEAHESRYWLRILHDTNELENEEFNRLIEDIDEIIRILQAILKSSKVSKS